MLREFSGGRQVAYRINPQHDGNVEAVSEIYAVDYFKELGRDGATSPVVSSTPPGSDPSTNSSSSQLRRRVQAALEHVFLPAGYPNSVTDDLLAFALWDAAQVLATNVISTLSMRAVLLGVGVGESGANLTSSTLSWIMRDGTWLIGSIFFASVISQDLEYRAKSWRLIADFTNDAAGLLELCAPLFPDGQFTFRLVVVIASVVKALVGVCGSGTRASFAQHFALRSNAADVAAKAGMRSNVGSLIGLALGMTVAYIVPASLTILNLSVFVLSTAFHLFANYKAVRAMRLRHLNAPRLEWCCEHFHQYHERAVMAAKKEAEVKAAMPVLDVSVRRANTEERLLILPALPVVPPRHSGLSEGAYRLFRQYLCPPTLQLRIHCGGSFYKVLMAQATLPVARKQELVQSVEGALSAIGIALLFDEVTVSYHVILPEFYTVEGVPESWVRYKRQYEAEQRKEVKRRRGLLDGGSGTRKTGPGEVEDVASAGCRTSAEEADEEASLEIERLRKERVVVPPHVLPLAYRELWAFFYAYAHHRAVRERMERGRPHANAVLPGCDGDGGAKGACSQPSTLHLISHLRADGMLDGGRQGEGRVDGAQAMETSTTMDPDLFEELTSPASTTSSKLFLFPSQGGRAAAGTAAELAASIAPEDGLYPQFIEFVRELRKAGWELDRLLIDNEGYTTVVHYL
ncbi:hypothetical protein ABL78_6341 [Leptomonas seymouri]|uniref:Protein root UVB sensitive/RUS domain-containing protein n=1 Tax=Leptomonas seymouri TaxID=5684 RepID=A0A0N0P3W6_LEPSE|nr:hypothetical protein ABL78_6341 [Leptomonas seymouri]|eukprot:KPI84609.1 hypothetical protein ABL78_6341 [Leptomonas seymouri]